LRLSTDRTPGAPITISWADQPLAAVRWAPVAGLAEWRRRRKSRSDMGRLSRGPGALELLQYCIARSIAESLQPVRRTLLGVLPTEYSKAQRSGQAAAWLETEGHRPSAQATMRSLPMQRHVRAVCPGAESGDMKTDLRRSGFERSGLAALSDLNSPQWREIFNALEREQQLFL